MNNKEQSLLQIGRLKEMEDGKGYIFAINKLLQYRFTTRKYYRTDRDKVVDEIYEEFKMFLE
jgi:hypothetical protein